jgi:hypothetical protein
MDRWLDATVAPDVSMSEASASAPLPQSASMVRPISMIAVIVRELADAGPTAACRRSGVSRVRTPSDASALETACPSAAPAAAPDDSSAAGGAALEAAR